jgi:hypothetical protein
MVDQQVSIPFFYSHHHTFVDCFSRCGFLQHSSVLQPQFLFVVVLPQVHLLQALVVVVALLSVLLLQLPVVEVAPVSLPGVALLPWQRRRVCRGHELANWRVAATA